jgi:hypothetical protein
MNHFSAYAQGNRVKDFPSYQEKKPKSSSIGSTYQWRIAHRDGRILVGYSKMADRPEKPAGMSDQELLMNKIDALYRNDYLFKLSTRVDFFLMVSGSAKEAVHFLSMYETGYWIPDPALQASEKWKPVIKHIDAYYQNADQVSYPDPKSFFSDQETQRKTFFRAIGKEIQQSWFDRFKGPEYTVDFLISNPKMWDHRSPRYDATYWIPFLNYLIKRGAEPSAINNYIRRVAEINPFLEMTPLPLPKYSKS